MKKRPIIFICQHELFLQYLWGMILLSMERCCYFFSKCALASFSRNILLFSFALAAMQLSRLLGEDLKRRNILTANSMKKFDQLMSRNKISIEAKTENL